MLTDKSYTEPTHTRIIDPLSIILTDNTGHDYMRNAHSNTSEDGELATAELIEEEESRNTCNKLADVNHTTENKGHLIVLTKSSEEDGGIVDESIDTRELLEEGDGEGNSRASNGSWWYHVHDPEASAEPRLHEQCPSTLPGHEHQFQVDGEASQANGERPHCGDA
ncbi:hypothetical protein HG530_014730 [Fusarium avenaceum]|nr:hypothetical protein HG530_014730 [Fusarium avenaceum]